MFARAFRLSLKQSVQVMVRVIVLLALPLTSVRIAIADEGGPDPNTPSSPSDAPLVQTASTGKANETDQALIPNPYGCVGTTNNPHRSSHVPGTVNVIAHTYCSVAVPEIHVQTTLFRWQCWGPFCWYAAYGSTGSDTQHWRNHVQANSAGQCITGWYKGESYHYIIGYDGIRYEAWTSREAYVNC